MNNVNEHMAHGVRHSLSRELLLPLVFGFVTLVVIITGLMFLDMGSSLEQSIKKRLTAEAETHKTQLETLFSYQILNTAAWSKLEVMDDIITDDVDGRISRSLHELKSSYQLQGDIFAFNNNQQLIAASEPAYISDKTTTSLPVIWKAPVSDGVVFADKQFVPYSKQESIAFIHRITASFDDNNSLGFLVVTIPWRVVEKTQSSSDSHSVLLDKQGRQMISGLQELPLNQPVRLNIIRDTEEVRLSGTDYLIGSTPLQAVLAVPFDWTIASLEHKEQALQPVVHLGKNIAIVAISLTIMVIVFVVWLTRRVVKPIQQVTQTVVEIGQSSDLSKRVEITSANETGILADSFNRMTEKLAQTMSEKDSFADRLATLNKNLEQQVTDRTEAYRLANEKLQLTVQQLQQAQSQLIQSEKMASLGQLVAGIAHEINNPLGSINANIPVLSEYTDDLFSVIDDFDASAPDSGVLRAIDYDFIREDTPKLLASVKNAASRMKDIVLSLRNFSRIDEAEIQDVLLEDSIDTTLALLSHRLKNRITVVKNYRLQRPVSCYVGLINQVLMNLLANAEQAIRGEGEISVETDSQDDYAIIRIRDSGEGIDEAIMAKIFDPFFTTKPVGEGTGMGLSITYGIIEKHQGQIQVESRPGEGTTFTISLPMKHRIG